MSLDAALESDPGSASVSLYSETAGSHRAWQAKE